MVPKRPISQANRPSAAHESRTPQNQRGMDGYSEEKAKINIHLNDSPTRLAAPGQARYLSRGPGRGGASAEMVENAFRILISDPHVKAVLINIFGGILRCDVLAEGVVQAAKDIGVSLPIVVRLEGTNVEEGRAILKNSDLDFEVAADMADAARRVCAAG